MNAMTFRTANELFEYMPETGLFTWKKDVSNSSKAGDIAGCRRPSRPVTVQYKGNDYPMSKIAWLLMRREWPKRVYFIDDNKTNLCFRNLSTSPVKQHKDGLIENGSSLEEKKTGVTLKEYSNTEILEMGNIFQDYPYGGQSSLIDENSQKDFISLVKPKAKVELKTINDTKPRLEGKARLSQFGDKPEKVKCVCPLCFHVHYKTRINYTGNIPASIPCKQCRPKKQVKFTFVRKIENLLKIAEKIDFGDIK